jgi:hypothetical protein
VESPRPESHAFQSVRLIAAQNVILMGMKWWIANDKKKKESME